MALRHRLAGGHPSRGHHTDKAVQRNRVRGSKCPNLYAFTYCACPAEYRPRSQETFKRLIAPVFAWLQTSWQRDRVQAVGGGDPRILFGVGRRSGIHPRGRRVASCVLRREGREDMFATNGEYTQPAVAGRAIIGMACGTVSVKWQEIDRREKAAKRRHCDDSVAAQHRTVCHTHPSHRGKRVSQDTLAPLRLRPARRHAAFVAAAERSG